MWSLLEKALVALNYCKAFVSIGKRMGRTLSVYLDLLLTGIYEIGIGKVILILTYIGMGTRS